MTKVLNEIKQYLQVFLWQFVTINVGISASEYDENSLNEKLEYTPEQGVLTLEIVNKGCNSIVCFGSRKSPIEIYPGMSKSFGQDGFKRLKICHKIWFSSMPAGFEMTDCNNVALPRINKVQLIKEHLTK